MTSLATTHLPDSLAYYRQPGLLTDTGAYADLLRELPHTLPDLCRVVQGVLLPEGESRLYGVSATRTAGLRSVAAMLARIQEVWPQPLTMVRPPQQRLLASSRDYATVLCALLRYQGTPARVRCGFASYLAKPGTYAPRWICEYWQAEQKQWVAVDAQWDEILSSAYNMTFDPYDLSREQFLVAAQAWQSCRLGQNDARRFGLERWRGLGFIRGNLLKDMVALNKIEVLPTDHWWGLFTMEQLSTEEMAYLDHIAELSLGVDVLFAEVRATYERDSFLYMPVESQLRMAAGELASRFTPSGGELATLFQLGGHVAAATQIKDQGERPLAKSKQEGEERTLEADTIIVRGAHQHNLKHIDLAIPRYKLVVLTGVSGSGKSSLAFDTIYAEGQRRYVESLSPFVRHFLDKVERPKVDFIGGLSPAIAIEQKTVSKNPRSTVGTVTEVSHYLRLLYSRVGTAHCPRCGFAIVPRSPREITDSLATLPPGSSLQIFAPLVYQRKGTHREVLASARHDGYLQARIDGSFISLHTTTSLAETEEHTIDLLIDECVVPLAPSSLILISKQSELLPANNAHEEETGKDAAEYFVTRLSRAVQTAMRIGKGTLLVRLNDNDEVALSNQKRCPQCRTAFPELTSQHFSSNSPFGMCTDCRGLGTRLEVNLDSLIENPTLSILDGALRWFGNLRVNKRTTWPLGPLDVVANHYGVDLETPWQDLPEAFRKVILYGSGNEKLRYARQSGGEDIMRPVKGLVPEIDRLYRETESDSTRSTYATYMTQRPCPTCKGTRLCVEALSVTLGGKTIADINALSIDRVLEWVEELSQSLDQEQWIIAEEVVKEICDRLLFMVSVGLHYLMLDRPAPSLSGGEGQRVRLASQLGCGLVGVLYVLDEPSIGLHQRDHRNLLKTLHQLRDMGNTVLVVEHDAETMRGADWLIDLGPGAGELGGELVAVGTPAEVMANFRSLTGRYLNQELSVVAPNGKHRQPPRHGWLTIVGARLHNLKNVMVRIPLGLITCITGVSGSGKSSLIAQTLEPALTQLLNHTQGSSGPYERLEGWEHLDKVVTITQTPIGRTPRSNPATYVNVFDDIRQVFAQTPEARQRGYKPARFSFNVKGGRCEECEGYGQKKIEMHFLADVWVPCKECNGTRYNQETLAIRYRGKHIAEVLDMDVREALALFADHPSIARILQTLHDVGLDYIKLGQSATTLSGGEAQRVKLAKELSAESTGRTIYILDEPTTGLHFADIQCLLDVLHQLAYAGNTIVIIEHNLDVIKTADWVIDLGPEGGENGGRLIAQGSPEDVAQVQESYTGQALRAILEHFAPDR